MMKHSKPLRSCGTNQAVFPRDPLYSLSSPVINPSPQVLMNPTANICYVPFAVFQVPSTLQSPWYSYRPSTSLTAPGYPNNPPVTASHISPATFHVLYALQQYPPARPTFLASSLEYITLAPMCPMLHGVTEPQRLEGPLGVSSPTPLSKHSQ